MPKVINRSERAAALIIVLAFVVLLTGLVIAYLSRATSDRQVAYSSFNQSKANVLAVSVSDLIIGDLRNEIANGSSPTPTPSPTVSPIPSPTALPSVFPLITPAYIVPMRNPTPAPGTTPAIPNLIRRSVRSDEAGGVNAMPSPSPGVPSHASAVNSTNDASANGRYVKLSRWNKHYLIPRTAGAGVTDTTPISAFNALAPDWVLLTRNGPTAFSTWNASLADPTLSNNNYCVGRYAYAIYDEGGLLDANVAGYPSSAAPGQYGPKGVSAFADLTVLGLSGGNGGDIDQLVGWRNYLSTGPTGNFPSFQGLSASGYINTVLSNTNGFMGVAVPSPTPKNMSNTDQQFTTRQSLIQLAISVSTNAVNALQYLGTFSREFNAPSWTPTLNASDMGGNNGGSPGPYSYKDNAANPAATPINPNLSNVTVQSSFTRADGNTANPGEPLIDRRFPFTRINGLADPTFKSTTISTINNGVPVAATPATVQRDFGLNWDTNNNRWTYVGSNGGSTVLSTIEPLYQIAANDKREPNFFELLKAAILSGSVGMGSGSTGNTFVGADAKYYSTSAPTSSDYQIMQIGANIISQWDSSNTPTFIYFGTSELAGIKNLPYLNKLIFKPYWHQVKQGSTTTYQFDAWFLPSLWNPHQNAASATGNVRVALTLGTLTASAGTVSCTSITGTATNPSMIINPTKFTTPTSPTGVIGAAFVSSSGVSSSGAAAFSQSSDGNPGPYYGFHVQSTTNPTTPPSSSSTANPGITACTFQMQVQVNGTWKAYQTWTGCSQPATPLVCAPGSWFSGTTGVTTYQDPEFVTLDPRTLRFGVWGNASNQPDAGGATDLNTGVLTTLETPAGVYEFIPAAFTTLRPNGSNFNSPTSKNLYLYANNADATVHYSDLDGVQRLGDPIAGTTTAMLPTDSTDRPLILAGAFQNGVFQSVAELGQIFRDQPWKTLSFTTAVTGATANSADAGLLDIFTLHESNVEAGKTSLNTKQPLVLKALLSQASMQLTGGSLISSLQLNNIITALTDPVTGLTTTQPMVNKAELVTRLASNSSVTGLGNKTAREAVLRAFADTGQTRTWNLLIDLIAQSGRYPPNAGSGPNTTNPLANFQVDGEQHYWVHVAIDRFTGQVLDKQIEPVNE